VTSISNLLSDRAVFVDSSGFYALSDRSEQRRSRAILIQARCIAEGRTFVTTNYVVAETHALVLNRLGIRVATTFLENSETGRLVVVHATLEDEADARSLIYRQQDKAYSLTDAISFTVMRRLGLRTAFTFDADFVRAEFEAATP
jgi:predicted nucleic acid-binding protein